MSTNARSERVTALEAASALQDPQSQSGSRMPDGSPAGPGWMAGRLIDGFELRVDGEAPRWCSPRWLAMLQAQGYDRSSDGEVAFVVVRVGAGELRRFADVRAALRYGRSLAQRSSEPVDAGSLAVEARTRSGRTAQVVRGRALLGMARGALDAEPIESVSSPPLLR